MNPQEDLSTIFRQALERVDPFLMVRERMRVRGNTLEITGEAESLAIDLKACPKILVTGIGKASAKMAVAVEAVLGDRITGGAVVTKHGQGETLERIRVLEAGHPVPDEGSIRGACELNSLAELADERTLIINLISGGGSALFELPREGITLAHLQETTKTLLGCGADIREINCIRKHLSRVKGGGFARAAFPARMVNLILSDVMGDRLDTIASGITAPDTTTFGQALAVVEKYCIAGKLPATVMETLRSGAKGLVPETPKPEDPVFREVANVILGNNTAACRGAVDHARKLGYQACLLTSSLTGEAREVAHFFASMAKDLRRGASEMKKPAFIAAGGETTVTLKGSGTGGRNQELALSFLADVLDTTGTLEGIFFLSAGTDGVDGPTDAAGAFVLPGMQKAIEGGRIRPEEYLSANDSYHFFQKIGGLFVTGLTGTNVCDLQLLIVI
ncbi:MAG TPA: glycerate kinase [Deltaproteobacteria bacterium]|jgi:hydroxypyruvate reductase|nr:glycerate kinase [Deltaproteobacteria bacterium]HOI07120.1 glycerate kinase [Deltaproteobacteria bacterium]